MINYIAEKIKDADLVLVGLGEELDTCTEFKKKPQYQSIAERLKDSWMLPFIEKVKMEEIREQRYEFYKALSLCLHNKNYFIVSLCQDGMVRTAGLDHSRIVEPCGGYEKLQCSEKCSTELHNVPIELMQQVKMFLNDQLPEGKLAEPICPICGKTLVFNNVNALNYVEEGYLDQWSIYRKWLQGTVNKKVCVLEIGVGMKYPTVIRWPFEKITFYNQKSELFRVHSRLYQISEEIKERGHGISENPEDFIKELSKVL